MHTNTLIYPRSGQLRNLGSTGRAPYSISIRVQEYLSRNPGSIFDAQLVATDPSPALLADFNRGQGTAPTGLPPRIELSSVERSPDRDYLPPSGQSLPPAALSA